MSLDVYLKKTVTRVENVFEYNITHNLNSMAMEAGIYQALWWPEEIGITKAAQLIGHLQKGLELLASDPDRFQKFDAANGWGRYEDLVDFVGKYLIACIHHPDADVEACR